MVPRMVVRVRKAVRRLALRPRLLAEPSGADNEANWRQMLSELDARDRDAERRLAEAEAALNRLTLS